MHSGRLTASSPGEGCGSVFVCELPVLRLKKHSAADVEKGGGPGDSGIELSNRSAASASNVAAFMALADRQLLAKTKNSRASTPNSSYQRKASSPPRKSTLSSKSTAAAAVAIMGIKIPAPSHQMTGGGPGTTPISGNDFDLDRGDAVASYKDVAALLSEFGELGGCSVNTPLIADSSSLPQQPTPSVGAASVSLALLTPTSKTRAAAGKSREDTKRVLVVDDAAPSRKMLLRWLQNAGYVCYSAVDGQDCLDVVDRLVQEHGISDTSKIINFQPLDFIFMDFEMPRMNGPDATLALRKRGITVPIIGVTGNVLPADKEHFLKHGATSVFHKPLDLVQLKEEMLRHFTQY
jgi:CheY-like chemotaxis protein